MARYIFPHVLVRYAGIPFSTLQTNLLPAAACMQQMAQLEAGLLQQRNIVCEQLYTAIQATADPRLRQQLLQLKRNVYNDKAATVPAAAEQAAPALQTYLELCRRRQQLQQQWNGDFERLTISARQQLQALTQHELLRKGILLSSPVLYEQLNSFAKADAAAFRNRELKNEYSLLRYITRMGAKTSPFSTFTCTGTGLLDEAQPVPGTVAPETMHSVIRLHNGLFTYIRLLMLHHPVLNEILDVKLNVTANVQEEQLQFLVNYFNVEAFQRLPARNLPLWLYHYLQGRQAGVSLGQLVDTLCRHIPDTDRATIKAYVLKLVSAGLLEPEIGCSGIDPGWDKGLAAFLAPHLQLPEAAALNELLQQLHENKMRYAAAGAAQRQQLLQAIAAQLNNMFCSLQQQAGLPLEAATPQPEIPAGDFQLHRFHPRRFTAQDIFYEDACTPVKSALPAAALRSFVEEADHLCNLLAPMDALQEERQRMRGFFLQHYGAAAQVPVTEFYYAYYRYVKKPAKEQQTAPVIKELPLPDTLDMHMEPFCIRMYAKDAAGGNTGHYARGMFVQLFENEQGLQGMINALLPGMGKVAGRFLHLFDPSVTQDFREWNARLHQPLMMELNDGSAFNANIHPPLLPHEVCMPGGNNNYPAAAQLSLQDIAVKCSPDDERLQLYHTTQRREIYAYDLCLESFYNRSHFYQLLAHFNPEQRLPLRSLILAADRQHAAVFTPGPDIQQKPRITFGRQVIVRRRGWLLRTAAIPAPLHTETPADYCMRLNQWRLQHALPEHMFLFLRSPYIPSVPGQKSRLQRDDYKPQYMCFAQPLLVNLFRKLLSRAGNHIYLEEMLPHADHLSRQGPAAAVTEYLLHWYNF